VPLKENLVDKIWESRPPHIVAPVCIQPLEFTGRSAKEKISDLREKLCQEKANAIVVTTLDEVILVGWVHWCLCTVASQASRRKDETSMFDCIETFLFDFMHLQRSIVVNYMKQCDLLVIMESCYIYHPVSIQE
jgi:hypothetical protein